MKFITNYFICFFRPSTTQAQAKRLASAYHEIIQSQLAILRTYQLVHYKMQVEEGSQTDFHYMSNKGRFSELFSDDDEDEQESKNEDSQVYEDQKPQAAFEQVLNSYKNYRKLHDRYNDIGKKSGAGDEKIQKKISDNFQKIKQYHQQTIHCFRRNHQREFSIFSSKIAGENLRKRVNYCRQRFHR